MSHNDLHDEKASTLKQFGDVVSEMVGRRLATTDDGREIIHFGQTNEIVIRDRTGIDRDVERVDLEDCTRYDYRVWVENQVSGVEVEWFEEAF
jgi:hypothetical protein